MATRFTSSAHAAVSLPLVTAFLNQKGGVGKTGVTVGAGGALAEMGRRVLMIDLDPQGHLTCEALRLPEADQDGPNLARALTGEYEGPIQDLIISRPSYDGGGQLDVIPTTLAMFLVVRDLYSRRAPETKLARLLEQLPSDAYDHILIDCPPSLDILTDTALVAADGVVIPVQPSNTSLRALRLLIDQIAAIENDLRLPRRELYGMVPGLYRRPLSGIQRFKMAELERYTLPDPDGLVEPLPILAHLPLATIVEEAWLSGEPVTDYRPSAPIADAYRKVALRLDIAAGLSPAEAWEPEPFLEFDPDGPHHEELYVTDSTEDAAVDGVRAHAEGA
ncbi:ParA family protein [Pseudonocardia dioxanivorans]|uniref:Cobyrinic acid ac-diamide synthase n=1 Tax=Pseudonocardia dioxanivorans (strain ATCC 55486 / DSM 44775 / JCM 13855 / CB1190) TaxID=675635 RepID=F2L778_PSEUX|nr:ParA family protein [Pseudonocardia dioxanivorans]AEA29051.1 Cobyrinic acid ac-diamide synthase [Pseudonocardia dioxanivorans CB1190]